MNDYNKDIERLKSEQETLKAQVEAELAKLKIGKIQYETVSKKFFSLLDYLLIDSV